MSQLPAQQAVTQTRHAIPHWHDLLCAPIKTDPPVSDDFMSCGADVSWLSVYPAEAEVLYPPLTYLRYVKSTPIESSQGVVVDARPSF